MLYRHRIVRRKEIGDESPVIVWHIAAVHDGEVYFQRSATILEMFQIFGAWLRKVLTPKPKRL